MYILILTPHKGEMDSYFLTQQVEMIKSLKGEIINRNRNVDIGILPLHEIDFSKMTMEDLDRFIESRKRSIDKADLIHSFSTLPLKWDLFPGKSILYTLNAAGAAKSSKRLFPSKFSIGREMILYPLGVDNLPYQELLPGFTIDPPAQEYSHASKKVIIFTSTRGFFEKAVNVVKTILPDAEFYVKFRTPASLEAGESPFTMSMLEDDSFLFAINESDYSAEVDLLPLKVMSRGIPVFVTKGTIEEHLYPEECRMISIENLASDYNSLMKKLNEEDKVKDFFHSYSCRMFFFSKLADDLIRIYGNMNNVKKISEKRPWGDWQTLLMGNKYKVKTFMVYKGESLSLQKHKQRKETWIVLKGNGIITVGDEKFEAGEGDLFLVEPNQIHRAEGLSDDPFTILEVQSGDYLGEDDITRLEDKYER